MQVFHHHIYEFKKGLRNLILHTAPATHRSLVIKKLEHHGIDYLIYDQAPGKINIFFGDPSCIQVLRLIGKQSLNHFTLEEDFMLGIMLGYDRKKQCERYITRSAKAQAVQELTG
ncbi:DUF2023 family protein [Desulfurispirillum indicum]|uniref:DUF2023 domain-containing protein n=1 Tax=Desulfurispirillum indicum (strain ATCC BAA-1389 / DSM 22839 / S5) TaxID=653733 RepID=E6W322_DESIS|nr:DUF2023 family protein [Desulfurispirillum indicum]ADU65683.1 Domain of unknown function DUF2023 [Desulfurispirillum indicum S5]UCZ57478.1 DUF2023 family protein [Desulfurispirillum indicum]